LIGVTAYAVQPAVARLPGVLQVGARARVRCPLPCIKHVFCADALLGVLACTQVAELSMRGAMAHHQASAACAGLAAATTGSTTQPMLPASNVEARFPSCWTPPSGVDVMQQHGVAPPSPGHAHGHVGGGRQGAAPGAGLAGDATFLGLEGPDAIQHVLSVLMGAAAQQEDGWAQRKGGKVQQRGGRRVRTDGALGVTCLCVRAPCF